MNKIDKKHKYFLGIDWGESRCGLALADSENRIASGLKEIKQRALINELDDLRKKFFVGKIILGEVDNKKFNQDVLSIKNVGIEVVFENEKFSTLLAQRNLKESNKKEISKNDNIESARIILQTWLDRE